MGLFPSDTPRDEAKGGGGNEDTLSRAVHELYSGQAVERASEDYDDELPSSQVISRHMYVGVQDDTGESGRPLRVRSWSIAGYSQARSILGHQMHWPAGSLTVLALIGAFLLLALPVAIMRSMSGDDHEVRKRTGLSGAELAVMQAGHQAEHHAFTAHQEQKELRTRGGMTGAQLGVWEAGQARAGAEAAAQRQVEEREAVRRTMLRQQVMIEDEAEAISEGVQGYRVYPNKECGGHSIGVWADGNYAMYGLHINNLEQCEEICTGHEECAGFVVRASDGLCSFWKKGPLQLLGSTGHDCHVKQGFRIFPNRDCGGDEIKMWDDGTEAQYESTNFKLLDCEEMCSSHEECSGFALEKDRCSMWRKGPLKLNRKIGRNCHIREGHMHQGYRIYRQEHCGGSDIGTWLDGEDSTYGSNITHLRTCEEICSSHDECAGFVVRVPDKRCSFWKHGPMELHLMTGYECHVKEVYKIHPGQHCGGSAIETWDTGANASYGSSLDSRRVCEEMCTAHNECAGFVVHRPEGFCSYWRAGPLKLHSRSNTDCHLKEDSVWRQKVSATRRHEVCQDKVEDWRDPVGATCQVYAEKDWCTPTGGYGKAWQEQWPSSRFNMYTSAEGLAANDACCSCGGGKVARLHSDLPEVCANSPLDWTDKGGSTCHEYSSKGWCTPAGGYGQTWLDKWPEDTFDMYTNLEGVSAVDACCECGGGKTEPLEDEDDDSDDGEEHEDGAGKDEKLTVVPLKPVDPPPPTSTEDGHEVCRDAPYWQDTSAGNCMDYAVNNWCTPDGDYGKEWKKKWPDMTFDMWVDQDNGLSAIQACCQCGGGEVNGKSQSHESQKIYRVFPGRTCGGQTIERWSNGQTAIHNFTDIQSCQEACLHRVECEGFVVDKSDGKCSLWRKGPFHLELEDGKDCHMKTGLYRRYMGHVCGGQEIHSWADGSSSNYGSSTTSFAKCEETCTRQKECVGFVEKSPGIGQDCSLWQKGPLHVRIKHNHTCWVKEDYKIYTGHHCGGENIKEWEDGLNAEYGSPQFDVLRCEEICTGHDKCAGFVTDKKTGKCSLWKKGPLRIHILHDHDCHAKQAAVAPTPSKTQCEDLPLGSDKFWMDSSGATCEEYRLQKWCTRSGDYGEAWLANWPEATFYQYHSEDNLTAPRACCVCGGGWVLGAKQTVQHLGQGLKITKAPAVEAPVLEACRDQPKDWTDNGGYTCEEYAQRGWCTPDGAYGETWRREWPTHTFDMYPSIDGIPANEGCCLCGGGRDKVAGKRQPHEQSKTFRVYPGRTCGGRAIEQWSNGQSAVHNFTSISSCEEACLYRAECDGFIVDKADGRCSIWRRGPLQLAWEHGKDCHAKTGLYRRYMGHVCGGQELHSWANGSSSGYGSQSTSFTNCQETCTRHKECVGFTETTPAIGQDCSLWQRGPLHLRIKHNHTCWVKEGYRISSGHSCGGENIKQWEDGLDAEYGSDKQDVVRCEEICTMHDECAGFVTDKKTGKCSLWKKGPLRIHILHNHDCHAKEESWHPVAKNQQCKDLPRSNGGVWMDSAGATCKEYHEQKWCTASGGYGEAQLQSWPGDTFEQFHSMDNDTAPRACCVCGGGAVVGAQLPPKKSRVSLSKKREEACTNQPKDWTDNGGFNCEDYAARGWCTPDGGYGESWRKTWPEYTFDMYPSIDGTPANKGCCVCGGGNYQACHTAKHGEPCYVAVQLRMQDGGNITGIEKHLDSTGAFIRIQELLHIASMGGCPRPCLPADAEAKREPAGVMSRSPGGASDLPDVDLEAGPAVAGRRM